MVDVDPSLRIAATVKSTIQMGYVRKQVRGREQLLPIIRGIGASDTPYPHDEDDIESGESWWEEAYRCADVMLPDDNAQREQFAREFYDNIRARDMKQGRFRP